MLTFLLYSFISYTFGQCTLGGPYTGTGTYHTPYDTAASSRTALTVDCGLDVTTVQLGDDQVAAISSSLYGNAVFCGDFLNVTGPNGSTIIQVIDYCGGCSSGGSLDLSEGAFSKIGATVQGEIPISWYIVPGTSILGSQYISYRFKDGSSASWLQIQVLNTLIPITNVILGQNGVNLSMTRQTYNYWGPPTGGTWQNAPFMLYIIGSNGESIGQAIQSIDTSSNSEANLYTGTVQFKDPCGSSNTPSPSPSPNSPTPTPTTTNSHSFGVKLSKHLISTAGVCLALALFLL